MSVLSQTQTQTLVARRERARRHYTSLWVTAREAFWIAVEALRTHKLRSFLTLLGVVISTTTLIVVMSIVNGMNTYIAEHIANLGANVFILHQFNWATDDTEWLKERRRNLPMRIEDYEYLRDNLPGYKAIGAESGMRNNAPTVRYQGHTIDDTQFAGVTPSMINIGQEEVEYGRFFTEADYEHSAEVCFVGQDVINQFFPNVDALGKEILVGGTPFRVVGVAKRIGTVFGQSQDNFLQVPLTAFRKAFVARPQLAINIQAWNSDQMPELEDEARALMRARRHLTYHQDDNFGVNASQTIMSAWHDLTGTLFAAGIGIVAVFMVIGGIVIMNIMLAAVTERTHEIGIRKSLGARRRDILWQFVIESGVMAGTGGVIGILLAAIISWLVNIVFTAAMPVSAVVVGITLSTAVGLFFGIYPASKAAKLDPIEALRTEN
ncbi:MAG TPA: ABC transporter permease [Terriglobia bacterium]|nr:ABC transporter permease [Terriglobia bacterium]